MARWDDTEWFRSSTWGPDVAAEFERRLARARAYNRAQYLRIQGIHLVSQADPRLRAIGRTLFIRAAEAHTDEGERDVSAIEHLGMSLRDDGMLVEAEHEFWRVLQLVEARAIGASGTTWHTRLWLAELLIHRGGRSGLVEADELLDAQIDAADATASLLRDLTYRVFLAKARVAHGLRSADAGAWAERALELAAQTAPPLPRHPDIGRVDATPAEQTELRAIAAGRSTTTLFAWRRRRPTPWIRPASGGSDTAE